MFSQFYKEVEFDGLWIDMNELFSFVDGFENGCLADLFLDYFSYVFYVLGGTLYSKIFCMLVKYYSYFYYDVYSLYGLSEMVQIMR